MENQHRKISGYRELTQGEIDLMNEVKALGPVIENVILRLNDHVDAQKGACCTGNLVQDASEFKRMCDAEPDKWVEQGMLHMQQGLMCLTRAVAQPTFF